MSRTAIDRVFVENAYRYVCDGREVFCGHNVIAVSKVHDGIVETYILGDDTGARVFTGSEAAEHFADRVFVAGSIDTGLWVCIDAKRLPTGVAVAGVYGRC